MGQDAGLMHDIPRAAEIVTRIAQEARDILERTLPRLIAGDAATKGSAKAATRR